MASILKVLLDVLLNAQVFSQNHYVKKNERILSISAQLRRHWLFLCSLHFYIIKPDRTEIMNEWVGEYPKI